MTILVTGAAGFLGMHVAKRLLQRGEKVVGVDNMDAYYSLELKEARLAELEEDANFTFHYLDIGDSQAANAVFALYPDLEGIVHMAAQVGVGHSLANPQAFLNTNISGMFVLLEECRKLKHLKNVVYGSSSAVYGGNRTFPFRVEDRVERPLSLYAATKKADELMSESYAHLYRLPQTGLRFFTVYGPWGRPDMVMWIFTRAILAGEPIALFNHGEMERDFTYVDDIVAGIVAALDRPPADDGSEKPGGSISPHALYNIGNNRAEPLGRMIDLLEAEIGRPAIRRHLPMQPGDVSSTCADIAPIQSQLGFVPRTTIDEGIPKFVRWYREFHGLDDQREMSPTSSMATSRSSPREMVG